jgi:hypothetical protein
MLVIWFIECLVETFCFIYSVRYFFSNILCPDLGIPDESKENKGSNFDIYLKHQRKRFV